MKQDHENRYRTMDETKRKQLKKNRRKIKNRNKPRKKKNTFANAYMGKRYNHTVTK
jgi:hypothetical protein